MVKISIIGTGKVGTTTAIHSAFHEPDEIILVDRHPEKAKGICLDLMHSLPLDGLNIKLDAGNYSKTKNSDIIVITAGFPRKPGMSRDDLLIKNAKIVAEVVRKTYKLSKNAIYIIVTNPLDAMCYVAAKVSKFPKKRILGMAGVLDTARFKAFLSQKLKVDIRDIETMVLGSHGDDMVPLIDHTLVKGEKISNFLSERQIKEIVKRTQNAGAEIVKLQKDSSAYIAPGASISHMIDSIINDKKSIMPCSSFLSKEYNSKGIFMGVPVILGKKGAEKIIELKLSKEEKTMFKKSIKSTQKLIQKLEKEKF